MSDEMKNGTLADVELADIGKVRVLSPEELAKEKSALARPGTKINVDDLALLEEGRGEKVILQRAQILATARYQSLRATFVTDWTLFKTPEGQVYGFLGDQGCERAATNIWGIQLSNFGPLPNDPYYEERGDPATDDYSVRLVADGYCDLTKQRFDQIEGFGYATDEDAQRAPIGEKRKDRVKNHARRNLAGKITRRAAGLEGVAIEELAKAWENTGRDVWKCAKGKGFGPAEERLGAASIKHGIDPQDIPNCEACENMKPPMLVRLVFRQGKDGREGFFGCPNWEKHKDRKVIINLSKLKEQLEKRQRQPGEEA